MSHLLLTRRKASSLAAKFAFGAAVATPLVAISQASFFLLNYRINHADAPRPICPSRGALLVQSSEQTGNDKITVDTSSEPPMRVLVIGDSIAMGIGVSRSATPILPVSIARSLSKAMGGRIVEWTCHGKPGLSATKLVKEIEDFQEEDKLQWDGEDNEVDLADANEVVFARDADTPGDSCTIAWNRWKSFLRRQRDPKLFGNYDAVVVIVGMGDLKAAALPFLHLENNWTRPSRGFRENLVHIRNILMRNSCAASVEHPLVVFPALPAKPVPIFQLPPLSWFVIPLLEMLDDDKRAVADAYRGNVIFAEEPTKEMIEDFEKGTGSLNVLLDKEDITFGVIDSSIQDRYREQFAENGLRDLVVKETDSGQSHNNPFFESFFLKMRRNAGSTLVAPDNIHPNNDGYDFFGRHIASEILHRWKRKETDE